MREVVWHVKKKWPIDAGDIFVFASLGFIFYGMYLIRPAFAYLSVGVIMLLLGILMIRAKAGPRGDDS